MLAELSHLTAQALQMALWLSAPALAASLVVGLAVALLQTITQLQELTLSYVPKLLAVGLTLVVCGGWMGRELLRFTTTLWSAIPILVP